MISGAEAIALKQDLKILFQGTRLVAVSSLVAKVIARRKQLELTGRARKKAFKEATTDAIAWVNSLPDLETSLGISGGVPTTVICKKVSHEER